MTGVPDVPSTSQIKIQGAVILKDWLTVPTTGRQVKAVAGVIEVLHQDGLVGFHVKGNESNWVARVTGLSTTVYVLGCQIRAFVEQHHGQNTSVAHAPSGMDSDVWVVS